MDTMQSAQLDKEFKRIIIFSVMGTLIEWAEYAFYGYMAVLIAKLFFPKEDVRAGIIAAFALFAAGFLMRPIGAVIVSHLADRQGRRSALVFSMLIMGIATFTMGILPTYSTIGLWAPLLLLLCRLTQGLAIANEMQGAAIFLMEHAGKSRPCLAGSWPGMAAAVGITLGGLAATLVAQAHVDWAWRIPFIAGALCCFIAFYFRRKIAESPLFLQAQQENQLVKFPSIHLFQLKHVAVIAKVAAMAIFVATNVYVCNLYFVTYLVQIAHQPAHTATLITTLGELLVVIFFPLAALLADKYGYQKVMQFGLLSYVMMAPFIFLLAHTGNVLLIVLAQLIYACFDALITAPMFKWLYDQFAVFFRVTGINVSWNIAVALLGGTAPLIVEHLVAVKGWIYAPGCYVSISALLALVAVSVNKVTLPSFYKNNDGVKSEVLIT